MEANQPWQAIAPDGSTIVGRLDQVEAIPGIVNFERREQNGDFVPHFNGDSRVNWDSQTGKKDEHGNELYVDANGTLWPDKKLTYIPEPAHAQSGDWLRLEGSSLLAFSANSEGVRHLLQQADYEPNPLRSAFGGDGSIFVNVESEGPVLFLFPYAEGYDRGFKAYNAAEAAGQVTAAYIELWLRANPVT